MNEDKATKYHRQRRRAAVASMALTGALLLGILLSGASTALGAWAESIGGPASNGLARYLVAAAMFTTALFALQEALGFPLAYYRGYALEHRYGLSRETGAEWLRDHGKAAAIGLTFALVATVTVYAAIHTIPRWWWLIAAALAVAAAVLLTNILPTVLLPIFYRLSPLDRAELRDRLIALARAQGVEALGVHVWGLGEKTRKANAALVGLGHTRRILLSDTLLAEYSDDEIEVILAHELAHHVHHDLWKAIGFEAFVALVAAWCADAARRAFGPALGIDGPQDLAALPLYLLGAAVASILAIPIANAMSRRNERYADQFALRLTGRPAAFISAMRRLGAQNLAEPRPSLLTRLIFYTHPPVEERIAQAGRAMPNAEGRTPKASMPN
ncbi:MAG TPA: M48 family metalloprotease [Vicinamibacterales bacterium]|nr:M48 family metalloprotease [Vicinamibacterales bacterium]